MSILQSLIRSSLPDNSTRTIEHGRRFRNGDGTRLVRSDTIGTGEDVALRPRRDGCGPAVQYSRTAFNTNGNRYVVELDVVEDDRAVKGPGTGGSCTQEDGRVGYDSVNDSFGADSL